jgi:hypothetical protein
MAELTETTDESAEADGPDRSRRAPAGPKLRSRKGGAAIPLDETDRRLMNLMQSEFPLDPDPYA